MTEDTNLQAHSGQIEFTQDNDSNCNNLFKDL